MTTNDRISSDKRSITTHRYAICVYVGLVQCDLGESTTTAVKTRRLRRVNDDNFRRTTSHEPYTNTPKTRKAE